MKPSLSIESSHFADFRGLSAPFREISNTYQNCHDINKEFGKTRRYIVTRSGVGHAISDSIFSKAVEEEEPEKLAESFEQVHMIIFCVMVVSRAPTGNQAF